MATILRFENGCLSSLPLARNSVLDAASFGQAGWCLVPLADKPGFALLTRPHLSARVNGEPVGTVVVLEHRDEVRIAGQCWCFSQHSRPQISLFHPEVGRRPRKCALCSVVLQDGDMVVVCPGCGRFYHQLDATADTEAKHCFTFQAQCRHADCAHPTDLSGSGGWQPELDLVTEVRHAS